ncbi:glycosyl transferase group 1/2 family protein [Dulcicalothrix desertica PCC 7102]|uniref:Glycosyl transferase group 1/2 family protein n=1 Tax=Dulcicalothrix desertica PCC 7102 TaxID=232991 RepID=A0A433V2D1_9CYAN|nr:glycosyltransferase family 4 protein [Dulcicalothrix desertica]RUT00236.1 glycosyl transferase group 1/2 family protein [Dulcicalothrix desertica PCC 7102]TWH55703.1 glycosyltransferase involved in cell wall biosynthesis [Dulcicalothrix desertica PCC 7102]
MNILHINQSDISGGAAIAGYRLHEGLLAQGIDSRLLVGTVKISSDRVAYVPSNYRIEKQLFRVTSRLGFNYLNYISSFNIPKHNFYKNANILNFHNLHTGYFNYLAIPSLTENKPAVFTLHDMWSFTGHCAYSYDCARWQSGCGKCPNLDTYPAVTRDSTHIEWKLKNWVYSQSNLTIVTPSHWLTKQAQQSMLKRFPIYHIPYGIDTEAYQPLDSEQCRYLLGIPNNKKVLLFAAEILKDTRKGGDLLFKALQSLPASLKAETVLLTFGFSGDTISEQLGIKAINLGYISSDRLKSIAYSAADLFIFPTRADNLPLVLQESMACGTPMVSFKIGGVPDLVRPNITGYLATPEDAQDFSNGIVQLLEDRKLHGQMSQNCREIALAEYTLEVQTQRYIELYRQVLEKQGRSLPYSA